MKFIEKDLEEIIYTSGRDVLEERGLLIEGELRRQVKIGNYGIADLISITKPFYCSGRTGKPELQMGCITIYELKKEQIGISAFLQVLSYVKGVYEYLKKRKKDHLFYVSVVLIGRNIDTTGAFCYIPELLQITSSSFFENGFFSFYTYRYEIDGLHFECREDFDLVKQGF